MEGESYLSPFPGEVEGLSGGHCLSNRKSKENLGMTLRATRRLGSLMLDKLVLDDDLAEMLGIPAVLIFTDPCIGDSFPAIVESMTAVEAAQVICCHAIPRYSIPCTIISDSEPAFASSVCQEFAHMMGIPEWDFGAVTVCTASRPCFPAASFSAACAAATLAVGGCMPVPIEQRPAGELIVLSIRLLYY